ncbi:MAG: hypothetical protein ACK5LP_00960 [Campylobacteraceae bacterium]
MVSYLFGAFCFFVIQQILFKAINGAISKKKVDENKIPDTKKTQEVTKNILGQKIYIQKEVLKEPLTLVGNIDIKYLSDLTLLITLLPEKYKNSISMEVNSIGINVITTVPESFSWDGASIPSFARPIVGDKFSLPYFRQSCGHDFWYNLALLIYEINPKLAMTVVKIADILFRDSLREDTRKIVAVAFYYVVRCYSSANFGLFKKYLKK